MKKGLFIGTMVIDEKDALDLQTSFKRKELISIGDVVYACINKETDEILLKIGKASGENGFYSRANTYRRSTDKTTAMMVKKMREFNITELEVYAVPIAKVVKETFDSFLEERTSIEISIAETKEKEYQAIALEQGYSLPLCTSKK
jgi:hypothetical protein